MRYFALFLLAAAALFSQSKANFPHSFPPIGAGPGQAPAQLTLIITHSPSSFNKSGQQIIYTYQAKNTGGVSVSGTFTVNDNNQGAVPCGSGTITPGNSFNCMATDMVTQVDVDAGSLNNMASVTNGTITSATVMDSVPAVQTPSLTLAKSPSTTTYSQQGQQITYNYTVTNTGNVTLTGFPINDDRAGNLPGCGTGGLAPSITRSCTNVYSITAADMTAGTVTNHASVTTLYHGMMLMATAPPVTITKVTGSVIDLTVVPNTYGVVCDGTTDDAPGIRSAMSAAAGMVPPVSVLFPGKNCVLGSTGGGGFNFAVPSNTTIIGQGPGITNLNQTPSGRLPITCTPVGTCFGAAVSFGSAISWHLHNDTRFKRINAPVVGQSKIFLTTPSDVSFFPNPTPGNPQYVAVWERPDPFNTDTQPAQYEQVTAVLGTGEIDLKDPIEIPFDPAKGPPSVSNITTDGLTHDSGAQNMTINAAGLPWNNQTFNVNWNNVVFTANTASQDTTGKTGYQPVWQVNSIIDGTWKNLTIRCLNGCAGYGLEGPQRQSGNILIDTFNFNANGDTVGFPDFSFGEWDKNITIQNSTFNCLSDNLQVVCLGALSTNGVVNNNTFNVTGTYNQQNGGILTDGIGSGITGFYVGGNKFTNNKFNNCSGAGNALACIIIDVTDTVVSGNTINSTTGTGISIYTFPYIPGTCCGTLPNSFQFNNNNITTNGGNAIFVNVGTFSNAIMNGWTVNTNTTNNHITAQPNGAGGTCTVINNNTMNHGTATGSPCTNSGNN